MGTIANKLEYLDDTKTLLAEKINDLGGNIDNSTTFREYAQELDNIYTNLPKTTGEGTNLSLNTVKGKMGIIPKGNIEQDGTPTPDTPIDIEVVTGTQEVKVENENLISLLNGIKENIGTTNSNIQANSITIKGHTTWSNVAFIYENFGKSETYTINADFLSALARTCGIKVYGNSQPNTTSMTSIQESVSELTANTSKNYKVTFNSGTHNYIIIRFWNNATSTSLSDDIDLNISNIQLELGSTSTTYTPHQEQTQIVSLGNIELCKIGNYQDYLYKSNDKWYKKELIKEVAKTFNWQDAGTTNIYYSNELTDYATSNNIPVSNYALGITNTSGAGDFASKVVNKDNVIGFINVSGSTTPRLYIKSTTTSGANLRALVFKVYYALANANDIEITNETLVQQLENLTKLYSYNGTTNISSSGNLAMVLSVSAIKGE